MTTGGGLREPRRGTRLRATAAALLVAFALNASGCAAPMSTSPTRITYIAVASVEIGAVITAVGYMGCRGRPDCKPWAALLAGLAATGGTAASMAYTTGPEPSTTEWAMLSVPAAVAAGMGGYELVKYLRERAKKKPRPVGPPPSAEPGLPRIIEPRRARFVKAESAATFVRRLGPSCLVDDGALYDLEQNADSEGVQMSVEPVPGTPSLTESCQVMAARPAAPPIADGIPSAPPLATSDLAVLFRVARPFYEVKPGAQPPIELWHARFTSGEAAAAFAGAMPPGCVITGDDLRTLTTPAREARMLETVAPLPSGAGAGETVCSEIARDGGFDVLFGWRHTNP